MDIVEIAIPLNYRGKIVSALEQVMFSIHRNSATPPVYIDLIRIGNGNRKEPFQTTVLAILFLCRNRDFAGCNRSTLACPMGQYVTIVVTLTWSLHFVIPRTILELS